MLLLFALLLLNCLVGEPALLLAACLDMAASETGEGWALDGDDGVPAKICGSTVVRTKLQ